MRRMTSIALWVAMAVVVVCLSGNIASGETSLRIVLPLERAAYQTNEWIDVTVVRSADADLAAGDMVLSLTAEDGGRMSFTFPMKASGAVGGKAAASEHLRLNGWLLRPGKYTLEAAADGATAKTEIEIHSHVRRSEFKVVDWSARSKDHEQAVLGEDSVGLNLIYAAYGGLNPDESIRGGWITCGAAR